jgi:hypothetical protein
MMLLFGQSIYLVICLGFISSNINFMPLPPPKKKASALPPRRHDYVRKEPRQNGIRFQPNQLFESRDEIEKWIKFSYPGKTVKIINTWEVKSIACQIEISNDATA